jgi:hypothetical protein
MNTASPPTTTSTGPFSENDFEQLAAAIDQVTPEQRELFLAKLVILLAAGGPSGTLAGCLQRARKNLTSHNKETT